MQLLIIGQFFRCTMFLMMITFLHSSKPLKKQFNQMIWCYYWEQVKSLKLHFHLFQKHITKSNQSSLYLPRLIIACFYLCLSYARCISCHTNVANLYFCVSSNFLISGAAYRFLAI